MILPPPRAGAHRCRTLLRVTPAGARSWLAACDTCGELDERYDPDGPLGNYEAAQRARSDGQAHEAYPDGAEAIIAGTRVRLR